MQHNSSSIQLSIVATIYNSEPIISELVRRISQSCEKVTENFEIILVEDVGPDKSWEVIQKLCLENPRLKGIQLSRNYGQQMAMSAGIRYATGNQVIIMDGDLQNPPEAIPLIVEKLNQGNEIVYTVSKDRNNLKDKVTSQFFWFIMNRVLKLNMVPNQLMLKGLSRRLVNTYNSYEERVRVVTGIISDIGLKQETLEVVNNKRVYGKSNYNFFKRFHLMIDIIIAMTIVPLNYVINLSIVSLLLTIVAAIYNLVIYFTAPDVPAGYTSIVLLILFFGSFTTLILGIIGRYLSNIYVEVRGRPIFIVNKMVNFKVN